MLLKTSKKRRQQREERAGRRVEGCSRREQQEHTRQTQLNTEKDLGPKNERSTPRGRARRGRAFTCAKLTNLDCAVSRDVPERVTMKSLIRKRKENKNSTNDSVTTEGTNKHKKIVTQWAGSLRGSQSISAAQTHSERTRTVLSVQLHVWNTGPPRHTLTRGGWRG